SLIERLSNDRGASFSLTLSNLMPYLIGSFLFAMPYSIQNGGFVTMLAFTVTALLADISAVALVVSMYEISPKSKKRKRICRDYVDIAREAFGEKASRFLNGLLLTHLFTSGIVCFVLLGQAMRAILIPYVNLSQMQIMAIFAVPTVPTLFVRKLSVLAYLSIVTILALFIGAIAT
ncbi:MAG: hypothetical protein GY776_09405, partial [Alteromonas sp.]|nr:hypothetical protein [Alteromonas sp.]